MHAGRLHAVFNPVNAKVALAHFLAGIEAGGSERADHGTGPAADAQVFVYMDQALIGVSEDGPSGAHIHARGVIAVEAGKGNELELCGWIVSGFHLDDLSERRPIGRKVILIHAGHDTGHASGTARQIK